MKGLRFFRLGGCAAGLASLLFFGTGLAHLAILMDGNRNLISISITQAFQISSNVTLYGLIAWAVAIPILLALTVALQLSDLVYQSGSGWGPSRSEFARPRASGREETTVRSSR